MDSITNFFSESASFNIVSFAVAIFAMIFSYYLYAKSKRQKKPSYSIETTRLLTQNLIKNEIIKIEINNEKSYDLSISQIIFENKGKETINSVDVAPANPLRIIIDENFKIYQAEIIFQSNTANNFEINLHESGNIISIDFDYIDFEDYVRIQLYHNAKSNENIKLNGSIKSTKKIERLAHMDYYTVTKGEIAYLFLPVLLVFIIYFQMIFFVYRKYYELLDNLYIIVSALFSLFCCLLILSRLHLLKNRDKNF